MTDNVQRLVLSSKGEFGQRLNDYNQGIDDSMMTYLLFHDGLMNAF